MSEANGRLKRRADGPYEVNFPSGKTIVWSEKLKEGFVSPKPAPIPQNIGRLIGTVEVEPPQPKPKPKEEPEMTFFVIDAHKGTYNLLPKSWLEKDVKT